VEPKFFTLINLISKLYLWWCSLHLFH